MTLFGITWLFPWGFLFLPSLIVLAWVLRKKRTIDMVNARIESAYRWWQVPVVLVFTIAFWIAVFLISLLLAQPHHRATLQEVSYEGIDVMVVLDVSESMQAADFDPTRLEGAKQVVKDFLAGSAGNRVGTILFSGQPFLFAPLTHDTEFLTTQTESITTDSIQEAYLTQSGTAIGDALLLAGKHIQDYGDPDRDAVIILITDGEANQGVDPLVAAQYLAGEDIPVYSVGLGDPVGNWYSIRQGSFTQQVFLKLDEQTLKSISQTTGGAYYHASGDRSLQAIFDQLSDLTKSTLKQQEIVNYDGRYLPFLIPLLVVMTCLLVLQMIYPRIRPW